MPIVSPPEPNNERDSDSSVFKEPISISKKKSNESSSWDSDSSNFKQTVNQIQQHSKKDILDSSQPCNWESNIETEDENQSSNFILDPNGPSSVLNLPDLPKASKNKNKSNSKSNSQLHKVANAQMKKRLKSHPRSFKRIRELKKKLELKEKGRYKDKFTNTILVPNFCARENEQKCKHSSSLLQKFTP